MMRGFSIDTEIPGLSIDELTIRDAVEYFALIDRNREHLTRLGDYSSMHSATLESVTDELDEESLNLVTGVRLNGTLIGRVDLIPKSDDIFVIGYWIDKAAQGHGYMTCACRSLIEWSFEHLDARELFAGVTHGNDRSVALLERLGFKHVADMGAYNRYQLDLPISRET